MLDGEALTETAGGIFVPKHRRRFGYVFQEARLFPHLSVRANLSYGRWFAPQAAGRESFDRIVDLLGIEALLERSPAKLSGGEKQRLAFARLLLHRPDIIVLDEATSALDPESQDGLMALLSEKLHATTIVSVGHRPELEAFHSRKIVLERRGEGARFVTDIRLRGRRFLKRWARPRERAA